MAFKDRKEEKTRDIKKSLVHKARLRKNYYKLLEREGNSVPEKIQHERKEKYTDTKLSYQDKLKINKERKLQSRKEALLKQQSKLKLIEQLQKKRELRKEQFGKKTKTGQPLMGPRISDLLTKIKANETI